MKSYSSEEQQSIVTKRAKLIASQQAICSPLFFLEAFVLSQKEAEATSAKTMKASPMPRVTLANEFTCKIGLCFGPSGRVTLIGG